MEKVKEKVEPDHIKAHKTSPKEDILSSEKCGCFYCLTIFKPSEITEWTDWGKTPICPYCGIDSILVSKSGYPVEKEFLEKMHSHWFSFVEEKEEKEEKV